MRMIRCQKCGATVISDEALLESVTAALDDCNRKIARTHGDTRAAWYHAAADYRMIFKALMHNLTQQQEAQSTTGFILTELRREILRRGLMTEDELAAIYHRGEMSAAAAEHAATKEIQRLYGDFNTICNRTKADPVLQAVIRADSKAAGRKRQ